MSFLKTGVLMNSTNGNEVDERGRDLRKIQYYRNKGMALERRISKKEAAMDLHVKPGESQIATQEDLDRYYLPMGDDAEPVKNFMPGVTYSQLPDGDETKRCLENVVNLKKASSSLPLSVRWMLLKASFKFFFIELFKSAEITFSSWISKVARPS